jgi:phosphomannomutase/phosphoglucomutase
MTDQPSDGQKFSPLTVLLLRLRAHPAMAVVLGIYLIASVLACLKTYDHLVADSHQQSVQQQMAYIATTQAARVNSYLSKQSQQLANISGKADVITALTTNDSAAIAALENTLLSGTDSGKLYLITPGSNRLDSTENFAAREMTARVFKGEAVKPEAVRLKDGWRILFASPVRDQYLKIVGTALYSAPSAELIKALQAESAQGNTELYQQIPGLRGNIVVSTGQKAASLTAEVRPTQLPYWTIRFTGSQQLLNNKAPLTNDVIMIFGCVVISLLLALYLILSGFLSRYKDEPLSLPVKSKTAAQKPEEEDISESKSYLQVIPSGRQSAPADKAEIPQAETQENTVDTNDKPIDKDRLLHYYPEAIFRDYDIRGISGDQINVDFTHRLGGSLGTMALSQGESSLIVGWDGRLSSPELKSALIEGITATGCNVISLGAVPTPILTFALHHLSETSSGVMVTASHNLAADNGFKIFFKLHALCGEEITALRNDMIKGEFKQGKGQVEEIDLATDYTAAVVKDIVPAMDLKVVLDAGNGIAGKFAIDVLEGIGCEVIPLYCDVNGNFPHHPPDTAVEENLQDLIEAVRASRAQLGIGLDGDGDRVVAIQADGTIVWPDELMMIFARDVLSRHPGSDIVYDIKCTQRLGQLIRSYGGRPVMWKTGHSHLRNKIMECNAPLGGEFSGHLFFRDRWHGSDDAIYAAARLIEVMMIREQSLAGIMYAYEKSFATPELKIIVPDNEKFAIVQKLIDNCDFGDAQLTTFDGLRVDFPGAWGLVRASNTSPALTLRFEGESEEELAKIKSLFRQQLSSIDSSLVFV